MIGFHSLPVCFAESLNLAPHVIFLKRHFLKIDGENNRTLFVVNVPPYCTKDGLQNIFSGCGFITAIHICDQPGNFSDLEEKSGVLEYSSSIGYGFKYAYIVFKENSSVDTALEMSSSVVRHVTTQERPVLTGVAKWMNDYARRYPGKDTIESEVDKYMRMFDEKELQEKDAMNNEGELDDGGWVTIPLKKKTTIKSQSTKEKRINKRLERKKKTENELMNFYQFQQRDAKRDKITDLRQKFEEDKKRIVQMRQLRKFKPF